MDLKTFLANNAVGIIAIFFTPLLAWLFNRKKESSEIKKVDVDATSVLASSSGQLATSWEKFAEKIQDEYNECKNTTSTLSEQVGLLKKDNEHVQAQIIEVRKVNTRLKNYTQKLTDFVEHLLDQMEKISPEMTEVNKEELARLKGQYQNE